MTTRILLFVTVLFFSTIWLSCKKEEVPDYRKDFVGIYSEGYTSIEIAAADTINRISITGIPYTGTLQAVSSNPNEFNIQVLIQAHSGVYGGPGCGYCLLVQPHILRVSGYGHKTNEGLGLYLLAMIEKKYSTDSDFILVHKFEFNLTKYN